MEFNVWAGLLGGFTGAVVMTLLMRAASALGMTDMPPMPLIIGAMASDDPSTARRTGMFVHIVVMGTVVFGLIYAAVFAALGTAGWLTGLIVGAVHGVVVGVAFVMMGRMHPRMEPVSNFTGGQTWRHDDQGLHIEKPGLFGRNYGAMTPMGLLVGHAVFGLVIGLVYAAIV